MSASWYKLDNSGKLFPAVADSINSSVYRMSVVLKKDINPKHLQIASNKLFDVYPMYMVGLKMGLFWYYLNPLKHPIKVEAEQEFPCAPFNFQASDDLIRILYGKKRISVEIFHSLTDGFGAMEFLKSLLFFYLSEEQDINDEGLIRIRDSKDDRDFEDSYLKHSKRHYNVKKQLPESVHIEGTHFNNPGNNVIFGLAKADELLNISRSYGVTMTTFLTAVMTQAIALEVKNPKKDPIVISIPINLRKHFESRTLSNFFSVANIGVIVDDNTPFEEILRHCKEQFDLEMTETAFQDTIANNVAYENVPGVRFIPAAIKNRAINLGAMYIGEKTKTITISNLGIVKVPQDMLKEIVNFEALLYPTGKSPMNAAMITTGNIVNISFITRIQETDIIKRFFRILSKDFNLNISIYSNDWERSETDETL